ncbi:MAG: alpha-glucosidase [Candidatus Izemoplasmatales bacterium]|jgi:oligo-1,6-glucosidase|nr:alpha-glucosidase [Candidatus Izemoplasmatales bacterium]
MTELKSNETDQSVENQEQEIQKAWYKEGVVYQIYPRSFFDSNNDGIGDIKGIIQKIPYLKDLGVDIVWLSPVYKSPMEDNGYDISDYQDIAKEFGTMKDISELIKKFHENNIKLVMDLVINHTSSEHPWFIKSENKDGKYTDYYHWEKKKRNWTSFFGGDAWEYSEKRGEYYLHLFAKGQPDLNWDNKEVREDIKKMIKFWLDAGVDGFRCDVINIIAKNELHPNGKFRFILRGREHYFDNPKLHEYLKELNEEVFSKYDCFTVGETVFVNPKSASDLVSPERKELNMVFQFDHMAADNTGIKWFIKKFKPFNLKRALSKWQNELNGWNTLYLENHDQARSISRFGNLNYYYQSATLLATIIFFQKGTPFIYQGQEIGMTNAHFTELSQYQDIETHNIYKLGRKLLYSHDEMMKKIKLMSRDNARTPMQWDDSFEAGFSKKRPWLDVNENYKIINVKNNLEQDNTILDYYKKIISLRHKEEIIVYGDYEDIDYKNKKIYAYKRTLGEDELYVLCNFSDKVIKIKDYPFLKEEIVLKNYQEITPKVMKEYEARVYLKKKK